MLAKIPTINPTKWGNKERI